jgi:hypothetical protein
MSLTAKEAQEKALSVRAKDRLAASYQENVDSILDIINKAADGGRESINFITKSQYDWDISELSRRFSDLGFNFSFDRLTKPEDSVEFKYRVNISW